MFAKVLLIGLVLGAAGNIASARTAYSKCLGSWTRSQVRAGAEEAAFQANLLVACKAEEAAFRAASIATDVAAKIARATAEQNASDEIAYIRENAVETFKAALPEPQ
ncbi:hypothetical protein [Sphingosinicella sp. LY1275]|uniref:hypothetical protein n=1 Tax=Sphingosinicella sp. LY1275 TaxID=3095379 RepID=UPI002ADECAD5|nr:hypothetical protein [Sphingosinicella sp. LY1275]MEA1014451.1 hypothetical protein [Sphingosinicella sp. LY1275]